MSAPQVGRVYYAPCSRASWRQPLVYGERYGFTLEPSQDRAVLYATQEAAEAALADPGVWSPRNAESQRVSAVRYYPHALTFASAPVQADHEAWARAAMGVGAGL